MADLSITAANVAKGDSARVVIGTAGETITAGQCVYLKSSDTRYWKAQNDGTSAEATAVGIALNGASAGQPISVQRSGTIAIGGTVAVGVTYCVSANAGGICPDADVISTRYKRVVGVGTTTANIELIMAATPTAVA